MSLLNYLLSKKYTDEHNSAAGAHGGNTAQIGKVYDTNGAVWTTVWIGSQAQYDTIGEGNYDANTLYLIEEA